MCLMKKLVRTWAKNASGANPEHTLEGEVRSFLSSNQRVNGTIKLKLRKWNTKGTRGWRESNGGSANAPSNVHMGETGKMEICMVGYNSHKVGTFTRGSVQQSGVGNGLRHVHQGGENWAPGECHKPPEWGVVIQKNWGTSRKPKRRVAINAMGICVCNWSPQGLIWGGWRKRWEGRNRKVGGCWSV